MILHSLILLAMMQQSAGISPDNCGNPFVNGVGPYDYNDIAARSDRSKIPIVERHHFTRKVELLIEGESQADPAGDIDYTLRAVPNHHRALYAISKYELRHGRGQTRWFSADCYFKRAIRFSSGGDGTVLMLYGLHYAMRDDHESAIQQYRLAEQLMPKSAELQYNLGLSLLEVGLMDEAAAAAKLAYDAGFPLPGLRSKLARHGYDF